MGNSIKPLPDSLGDCLTYCPTTGDLVRVVGIRGRVPHTFTSGKGCNGYLQVPHKGKIYRGHRVAWFLHYKEQPPDRVDHIDGDLSNNRINNLRGCSAQENSRNQHTSTGYSQFKGVSWDKRRDYWIAALHLSGKHNYLGRFTCEKEAALAYNYGASLHFGEFANYNQVFEDVERAYAN